MKRMTYHAYVGNTGFALKVDDKVAASVQGHSFSDNITKSHFWQLFETFSGSCEDEWLYYETRTGVFNAIADHWEMEGREALERCESCGHALAVVSENELEWCYSCGVIL